MIFAPALRELLRSVRSARPIEASVSFEICTHVCHKVTRARREGTRAPLCRTTARAAPFLFPTGVLTPRQTCYLGADFICAQHIGQSRLSLTKNRLRYFHEASAARVIRSNFSNGTLLPRSTLFLFLSFRATLVLDCSFLYCYTTSRGGFVYRLCRLQPRATNFGKP